MITYRFDVDCKTDPGTVKKVNEDTCTVLRHDALASSCALVAVADGVGGLDHGEIASTMAMDALEQWWNQIDWASMPSLGALMASMAESIQGVNDDILRMNMKKSITSSTTLTALLLAEEGYRIFHVGDSRVYRIEAGLFGDIEQLTKDHSKLMPKVVDGATVLKPYLTDCLGYKAQFEHQALAGTYQPGEMYLVCTDGIFKTIKEKEIGKIVRRKKRNVDKACYDLITKAKSNGEKDNLTAAVVRIFN